MHILFLEIDHEADWAVASIGAAYVAAFLRQHGHGSELFRVPWTMPIAEVVDAVRTLAPDMIGVSLTSRQWLRAREVIGGLREVVDIPVIAGGLHPTFAAEAVLASPGFDYACIGEGEEAMLELVQALEETGKFPEAGIPAIQRRGGPRPPIRKPFEPLDDMAFMARDHLDEKYGVRHMVTQRGCPFPCTYCAARQFSDLYERGYKDYGRRRSLGNVFEELDTIRAADALSYIIFLDDTFTIHHPWVFDFCREYPQRYELGFSLHARVETVNEPMIHALAAAGCKHITYGVESGSPRVRLEIMQRYATNQRFEEVFRWTREAGIMATANYILGIPGETREDIEMTLALHERLQPTDFGYFVFYPYQGTPLFKTCLEKGYLPENYEELPALHRQSILNLPDLSQEDIAEYYQRFTDLRVRDSQARMGAGTPAAQLKTAEDDTRARADIG